MAGTGQNRQQKQKQQQHDHHKLKYSYFHYTTTHNNENTAAVPLTKIPSSPSVCTSTHHQQTMTNSSTSPWYRSSTVAGANDESSFCDGPSLSTMNKQPSSLSLNAECTSSNEQPYENYGHFFVKKTFRKPTYCHNCVEMLWGLIGQGYYCEGKSLQTNISKSLFEFSLS